VRGGLLLCFSRYFRECSASNLIPDCEKSPSGTRIQRKYFTSGYFLLMKCEISLLRTPPALSLPPMYMIRLTRLASSYVPRLLSSFSMFSLVNRVHRFCIGIVSPFKCSIVEELESCQH
jgi:hypothetical protein